MGGVLPGSERDLLGRGGGYMGMGEGEFEKVVAVIQKMVEYFDGGGSKGDRCWMRYVGGGRDTCV